MIEGQENSEGENEDDCEIALCTSHEPGPEADSGHLFRQHGEVGDDVLANSFNRKRGQVILEGSVGLDSMSSIDVFGDSRLLTNIHTVNESMKIVCNAGRRARDQDGYIPWLWAGMVPSRRNCQQSILEQRTEEVQSHI